jgi:zinc protease
MVVVLGPREKKDEIIKNVEKMILDFPKKGPQTKCEYGELNVCDGDTHIDFDIPQTMILGHHPGYRYTDPKYHAKKLAFALVAGGSLNSMFYGEIREKRGLVYYCYGSDLILKGSCVFNFFAGTRSETVEEVKKVIKELFLRVSKNGVPKENFERTKRELLGSLVVGLESSSKFVSYFAVNRAAGRSLMEINSQLDAFKKVTWQDVNDVCKEMFKPEQLKFISIGGTAK